MSQKPVGWRKNPARHALAAKGIRTTPPKAHFRKVTVEIPADSEDFKALGFKSGLEEEPLEWVREWLKDLGHEPTDEDYLAYAERLTEHALDDPNGGLLEDWLSYLESSPKYQSSKRAWIEGMADGLKVQVIRARKSSPNFPNYSRYELRLEGETKAAVHDAWQSIMRKAEEKAKGLIRDGKEPIVEIAGERMRYDPARRVFSGTTTHGELKVE